MTEQTQTTPSPEKGKRGKKKRVLTFICSNSEGKLSLAPHETVAPTLSEAWRECSRKNNISGATMHGAVPGKLDWLPKQLRKPSYEELERMLAMKESQQE